MATQIMNVEDVEYLARPIVSRAEAYNTTATFPFNGQKYDSANKAYKAATANGFKGSFSNFLEGFGDKAKATWDKVGDKGYLEKGLDIFGQAKDLFGKGKGQPTPTPANDTEGFKLSGWMIGGIVVASVAAIGLTVYLIRKK